MTPPQLLEACRERGVVLWREGSDGLGYDIPAVLWRDAPQAARLLRALRVAKPALLELLSAQSAPQRQTATVGMDAGVFQGPNAEMPLRFATSPVHAPEGRLGTDVLSEPVKIASDGRLLYWHPAAEVWRYWAPGTDPRALLPARERVVRPRCEPAAFAAPPLLPPWLAKCALPPDWTEVDNAMHRVYWSPSPDVEDLRGLADEAFEKGGAADSMTTTD